MINHLLDEDVTKIDEQLCGSRFTSDQYLQLLAICASGGRALQELVEAEEFAAEGAGIGGPLGLAGVEGESGAGGGIALKLHAEKKPHFDREVALV